MSGHPARGLWSGHHLTWHINCLEMLAVFRALKHFIPDLRDRHVLVRNQPPGRSEFAPFVQAGAPDPCVGPRETPFTKSSSHPWASQSGSRQPVKTGAEARGMETPPRCGVSDLENDKPGSGGSVCDSGDIALSPLVLSDSSSSFRTGRRGTDLGEASSVRLPPIALLLGVLERVHRNGVRLLLVAAFWPGRVRFLDLISLLDGSPWEIFQLTAQLVQLVGSVLGFLQVLFFAGLSHSTLKVSVVALAVYHVPLGGRSFGRDPLVTCFLHGALRLRPPARRSLY